MNIKASTMAEVLESGEKVFKEIVEKTGIARFSFL